MWSQQKFESGLQEMLQASAVGNQKFDPLFAVYYIYQKNAVIPCSVVLFLNELGCDIDLLLR